VHWTPTLNLMWPAGIGGQELHWDAAHTAYVIDEPSHRFRGVVLIHGLSQSRKPVVWQNATHGAEMERDFPFTLDVLPGDSAGASVTFAGSSDRADDPMSIAQQLDANRASAQTAARERFASL